MMYYYWTVNSICSASVELSSPLFYYCICVSLSDSHSLHCADQWYFPKGLSKQVVCPFNIPRLSPFFYCSAFRFLKWLFLEIWFKLFQIKDWKEEMPVQPMKSPSKEASRQKCGVVIFVMHFLHYPYFCMSIMMIKLWINGM